ncbi:MAG: HEPN domain-containing protein [Candidatus Omnitrophota bacterium]
MSYERFVKANLVKEVKPDSAQVSHQLKRALKDLNTAKANLEIDRIWSLTIAYHAMLRAGRAFMFSKGYLPTTSNAHKTIVEFMKILLKGEYQETVAKFNRLRRRRHDFIYDSKNHVNFQEAKNALDTARKLINKIVSLVKKENPQKHLF